MKNIILILLVSCNNGDEQMSNDRVCPFGDSITRGSGSPPGYRGFLLNYMAGQSNIIYVGTDSQDPGNPPIGSPDHEGHPGFTLVQMEANVVAWFAVTKPSLVLLHGGTNDIIIGTTVPDTETALINLLNTMYGTNPQLVIIVAKIIPLPDPGNFNPAVNNPRILDFNSRIDTVVSNQRLLRRQIYSVDMNTGFQNAWFADMDAHPNSIGYRFMADKWYTMMPKTFPGVYDE